MSSSRHEPITSIRVERLVQVWSCSVSMKQLLLRATKSTDAPTRVDLLFTGVAAMNLPTMGIRDLEVQVATSTERSRILAEVPVAHLEERTCFVLTGVDNLSVAPFRGWIVAGAMNSCEDDGEYYEDSQLIPALPSEPPA
ncbi:MAG: hypothetical protein KDB35_19035 [Acidimicrobiales bacterium]|nr:hypothetical protein [Acidimicrobiales bacterium]